MNDIFIDEQKLIEMIDAAEVPSEARLSEILGKGLELKGLSPEEAAALMKAGEKKAVERILDVAAAVKRQIYGDRLVFFAPLYLSNYCVNDCEYCGFRVRNEVARKRLAPDEVREQTARLIDMGHKRVLLEAGEDEQNNPLDYVLEAIDTIYSVRRPGGEIRRINVNIAATSAGNYRRLKAKNIGTYQLFQETYRRSVYEKLHRGPKGDYERQLYAIDRAYEGGIDDVGLGVLFGLYDWRFEVLALVTHAGRLQEKFGIGPHTISVPRFRPAGSAPEVPPCPVSDDDFLRLIAILRIAVPYTGMIITTRERPEIRSRAFRIGITQASAASSTIPGGVGQEGNKGAAQFELADRRPLDEIALSAMKEGLTPSFCTACYRKERTGETFMDLARPGDIGEFCRPNSLLTLMEYLLDHASEESKQAGLSMIEKALAEISHAGIRRQTREKLERIRGGERDIFF